MFFRKQESGSMDTHPVFKLFQSPLSFLSPQIRRTESFTLKGNPFIGKVMKPFQRGTIWAVLILVLGTSIAQASVWSDVTMDFGIGILGLPPASMQNKHIPDGFLETQKQYDSKLQKSLTGIHLYQQPSENFPIAGTLAFSEDGLLGIQTPSGFFDVHSNGVPLGDGSTGWVVIKRQGQWVQVIIRQAPETTGWLKLADNRPFAFWVWYYYFANLVKTHHPVFFITPVNDSLLYQPNGQSLSYMKFAFQQEDLVLYPQKIRGAYMLVKTGEAIGCHNSPVPQFEKVKPSYAWIRWLKDDGRPEIFKYSQPQCN